jgi:hypothetical protein
MTISLAWIREVGTVKELILASDSRLCFGARWDCCPKILALPRNDSAICFSGDTMYAYPVMLQSVAAVAQHPRLLGRAMDIEDLKGHLLRVLNGMVSLIHDLPHGTDNKPDAKFLLGGWSWKRSAFKVWQFHYDSNLRQFAFRPSKRWTGLNRDKMLAFIGDYEPEFKTRLVELLKRKRKLETGGFDMEPLEVLRDMLRQPSFDVIGGAPQVMKVYRNSTWMPYAVFWPSRSAGDVSLLGRPLLDYEQSAYLVLDTDTMKTVRHSTLERKPSSEVLGRE